MLITEGPKWFLDAAYCINDVYVNFPLSMTSYVLLVFIDYICLGLVATKAESAHSCFAAYPGKCWSECGEHSLDLNVSKKQTGMSRCIMVPRMLQVSIRTQCVLLNKLKKTCCLQSLWSWLMLKYPSHKNTSNANHCVLTPTDLTTLHAATSTTCNV